MSENSATEPRVAYVTAPDLTCARRIASALVAQKTAACVNIVPALESVYRWQGNIEHANEVLLIIKTRAAALPAIEDCLAKLHPDDVPECIALPITGGSQSYLDWLIEQTAQPE